MSKAELLFSVCTGCIIGALLIRLFKRERKREDPHWGSLDEWSTLHKHYSQSFLVDFIERHECHYRRKLISPRNHCNNLSRYGAHHKRKCIHANLRVRKQI